MVAKNKKKITVNDLAVNLSSLTKTVEGLMVNLIGLTKTVENLAQEMRGGFAAVDVKIKESEKRIIKDIDIKIDELAMITKHGFDSVDEQFKKVDERFDRMDERFDKLEKTNTREHEDISLRLDEACPVK